MKRRYLSTYLTAIIALIILFIVMGIGVTTGSASPVLFVARGDPYSTPTSTATHRIYPTSTSTPIRTAQARPEGGEFFLLSLPLSTKPYLNNIRAIVWNALVDHTPPFYNYTDLLMQPYTGELAPRPTDSPPTPTVPRTGPGAYGETSNRRRYYYNSHPGLDLNANTGTPVYAAHAGEVSQIISSTIGYGRGIVLRDAENSGFSTLYGHLSDWRVSRGDRVARGQLIGVSGATGGGTGPHLHFGVYQGVVDDSIPANVLDPYSWFSFRYDNLRQRTPTPNEFQGIPSLYKWASGYPGLTNVQFPRNWNLGTMSGNQYIPKSRSRSARPPSALGRPPSGTPLQVHAIEQAWANNYGSVGAPFGAVFISNGRDCQYFEGGTLCDNGAGGYTYSPRFTDVTLDHWANRYIGWNLGEGTVTGYPCGVPPAGTCDDQNRPWFLPSNNMTRGQFSQVVSQMYNITDPPGGQIYEDVPPDNPFYAYINRLSNQGIMGGYPCNSGPDPPINPCTGLPETCPSPGARYFRWCADVTRGQASVILANSATTPPRNWLNVYGTFDGPDFHDVPPGTEFYTPTLTLYKAGVFQFRLEDPSPPELIGMGGRFYPNTPATRAEIAQFLHELVYASAPTP